MNKDPYGQLASSIYASFHKQTRQALGGVGAVLGTITPTGVKLDDFKHELPDYMVAEHQFGSLTPGDRVLAIKVNSGNDVVVVCKVVNGGG